MIHARIIETGQRALIKGAANRIGKIGMTQKSIERIADNMAAQNIKRRVIGGHDLAFQVQQNTGFIKQFGHIPKAFGQLVHNVTKSAIRFASTCRLASNQ